jgi:hypothetical protein
LKALYPIVGARHREGAQAILASLKEGEPLVLKREPDNAYDKNAIQVWARDQHVGYIPKRDNPPLAMAMDGKPGDRTAILRFSANSHFPHAEVEE